MSRTSHLALLLLFAWLPLGGCRGGKYLEDFTAEPGRTHLTFYPPEQVTAGNESSFAPDLSPNGEFVVYTSDRTGNKDIWEKRALGGFGRQITLHSADDFYPVISPNGKRLAFVSRREDAAGDIHVIDLGFSWRGLIGKSEGNVSGISSPTTEDTNPAWFPGSDRVVFSARRPGEKTPSLMTAELGDLKPVPLGDLKGDQPAVSPDGQKVAYVRDGAIYIYHRDTEKVEQITDGGALQDGQPTFTQDGLAMLFIRYADDTNGDGKLNGDDRPTVWRLDLAAQHDQKTRENYGLVPLTAATFSAYSPQIRGPFLYVALQTNEGLNIFRLPEFGQIQPGKDLDEVKKQFDQQSDYYEKTFVLRRGQAALTALHESDAAAEATLMELQWAVQNGRRVEAAWVQAKLKSNFPEHKDLVALSELALVSLDLVPLEYPGLTRDLTGDEDQALTALQTRAESIVSGSAGSKRVIGQGQLLRAKILASRRQFFEANKVLSELLQTHGDDRQLAAEAALYAGMITPATSDVDSAIRALRQVVATYPSDRNVVLRASQAAVHLLEPRKDRLEALVALRTDAKGTPIMPALAHMRIADIYMEQGKEAVAANELRQIVDLYPESPEVMLDAAGRLSVLEEKAGRYESAEAMLKRLGENLATALPEQRAEAKRLLVEFHLHRGEGLLKLKEPAMALKEYEKVIALEPLNVSGHRGKIDAAYQRKTIDALKDVYKSKSDADPQSAELRYFYGYARTYEIDDAKSITARLAAIDDCIDILESARQLNGQILHIHQTLGWLYMQKNFTVHQYQHSGSVWADVKRRAGMVEDFFGAAEPDWRELAIDSFQNAYFLSRPDSIERAGLAQNLGQAYFALKNYQKSLSYYMQRVKLLSTVPMRDPRAEAILLDRAGRSAFQTEELELAESLQRAALTAWENVNNDERIAYAIDALALTVRERGKFKDAITLYERLERLQERAGAKVNRVGSLSNLGYCAFMDGQQGVALTWFEKAETLLKEVEGAEGRGAEKTSDAIQVDLGGGGSAAKGFDLFARHVLILTFRAKIYEKLGRYDLALTTYEEKLRLLQDGQEKDDRHLGEEIAVLQNNIGEMRLAAGYHLQAKAAFKDAEAVAKTLRPGDQKYKASGEVLNEINRARVQLRLASLGLLAQDEVEGEVKELEATADSLRPVYQEGAKAEGRSLAQLLSLSSSLRAVKDAPGDETRLKASLEESLAIMKKLEMPHEAQTGVLLAYEDTVGKTASDAAPGLAADFRKQALAQPALAWKLLASDRDYPKAFEALDRFVSGGGELRSPTDRLLARDLFEHLLTDAAGGADAGRLALLLRRFTLLRYTDLVQRGPLDKNRVQRFLELKETPQALAPLADNEAVLMAHRTRKGQLFVFLQDKKQLVQARSFDAPELVKALPPSGGRLYIVPSAELYDLPWEKTLVGGEALGQRYVLSFLPVLDMLPDLYALRRLPKATIGHVGGQTASGELLKAANAARDYSEVLLDGQGPLGAKLANFDLVHVDAPLRLNDVEPGRSAVSAGTGEGATDYLNDLTLDQLSAQRLGETTALIFANVHRDNRDLAASGEGHEGWVFLTLAAAAAGVPTVVAVEQPEAPPGGAAPAPLKADWTAFYQALDTRSVGEAQRTAAIPGRIFGYPGIPGDSEVAYAKEHFEKTLDEAEDARADQEFDDAAVAYKRALYYSQRTGKKGAEDDILTGLVQSLYQKRDYAGALHFKQKQLLKLKPLPKGEKPKDGDDDDRDPVDYGRAAVDAAVLAVRANLYAEAESLLAEADAIFTEEDDAAQLGKIWQYRGINLENQKKYDETIAAYQKARDFYAKGKPEDAANQLLNIGNVYGNDLSNYPLALENYESAASEFQKLGKPELYIPVLIDKANTQMAIGELETAIGVLEHGVIPAIDKEKQRLLWVRSTQILANAYYRAGLYQEAKDLNERTLAEAEKIEPKLQRIDRQIDAIGLRGMILAKLGQYKEAFDDFRSAIALANEYNLKGQIALLYNNYGFWAREYGAVDQSIDFFNVARKLDEELKSRSGVAFDDRNMGLSIILKGDYNRARDLLTQALKESEELHLVYNVAYCDFGLADVAMREQKWEEAEGHFQRALAVSEQGYMQDFIWRARAGVAAAALKQKKTGEAEKGYAAAIAVVEKLRAGLKSEPSRSAFYSDAGVQEVYEAYAVVLMAQGKPEEAWQASERARARAFIDSLGTQKLKFAREDSNKLIAEEKERKGDVEALERRLGQATGGKATRLDPVQIKGQLDAARARYSELIQKMHTVDRQLSEFVKVEAISKDELKTLLGPDTALVEYQVTPEALLIWVLYDGKLTGKSVPVAMKDLQGRIRDFRMLMQNFSSTEYLGKELAGLLLEPVKTELAGAKRLAIVPHGNLHFLPFAALPFDGQEALIDRFPIYYLESATVARFTHGAKDHRLGDGAKILALANPETADPATYPDLPFAGKEAAVIGRYFPHVESEEGAAATKGSLEAKAGGVDVLHIASHGEFRPNAPAESRLLLAANDGHDGALQVSEIFGMRTQADLVTLSACDTGLGRLSAGDEIIGMNRAFFYAGANTVVSSLWRISDVASAVTMKRFYRYLAEGQDKAEAMRQAQMVVRRYFRHPAYWSAFRVLGDDR